MKADTVCDLLAIIESVQQCADHANSVKGTIEALYSGYPWSCKLC